MVSVIVYVKSISEGWRYINFLMIVTISVCIFRFMG